MHKIRSKVIFYRLQKILLNKTKGHKMTQKEIYLALLNGETLINDQTQEKIHLSDEWLVNEKGERTIESFLYIENWSIYKDPKDPKNWIGKLVFSWFGEEDKYKELGILSDYDGDTESGKRFRVNKLWYGNCRPATREEVEQYLVKEN